MTHWGKTIIKLRNFSILCFLLLSVSACASGNSEVEPPTPEGVPFDRNTWNSDASLGTQSRAKDRYYDWMTGDTLILGDPVDPEQSKLGNFAAGGHAQYQRDMSSAADFLGFTLKRDPDVPNLLRRTFLLLVAEGRIDEALPLAHRVLEKNDKSLVANLAIAVHDMNQGNFLDAEKRMAALPSNGISSYIGPLLRAWAISAQEGKTDDALKALSSLSKTDGAKALHDLQAALINDVAGRSEEAEKKFMGAIQHLGGVSLRLVELLGLHYERTGATDKAKNLYGEYIKAHPEAKALGPAFARVQTGSVPAPDIASATDGGAEGLFSLASSLNQQNARETALVFGRLALYLRPDFPIMQILLAEILEVDNRLHLANKMYKSINPASSLSWTARLQTAYNLDKLDRPEEAEAQLRAMADDEPTLSAPLINLGEILHRHERHKDAVEAFNEAIKRVGQLTPRHWRLLYSRGMALEQSKQWDKAEADFRQALKFQPDQPYVLNYLGYSLIDQGKTENLEEAMGMIRKAVDLRPNDGYIVDSLGWGLYQLKKYGEAVKEMERAAELLPEDPVINDHLGDTYWQVGRRYEARFQWNRALSFDPTPELKEAILVKVKNGLGKPAKKGN